MMDLEGPFGWNNCSADDFRSVLRRLGQLENMTWQELRQAGCHQVMVKDLSPDAQKRLRELKQDDTDHVYSVRVTAKERVICLRVEPHLYVLWWDPDHSVCLTKKR